MRVRMVTLAAGPAGIWRPGEVVEVDVATASTLLAAGAAVALDMPAAGDVEQADAAPADAPGVEHAVAPPAETATAKRKRK